MQAREGSRAMSDRGLDFGVTKYIMEEGDFGALDELWDAERDQLFGKPPPPLVYTEVYERSCTKNHIDWHPSLVGPTPQSRRGFGGMVLRASTDVDPPFCPQSAESASSVKRTFLFGNARRERSVAIADLMVASGTSIDADDAQNFISNLFGDELRLDRNDSDSPDVVWGLNTAASFCADLSSSSGEEHDAAETDGSEALSDEQSSTEVDTKEPDSFPILDLDQFYESRQNSQRLSVITEVSSVASLWGSFESRERSSRVTSRERSSLDSHRICRGSLRNSLLFERTSPMLSPSSSPRQSPRPSKLSRTNSQEVNRPQASQEVSDWTRALRAYFPCSCVTLFLTAIVQRM